MLWETGVEQVFELALWKSYCLDYVWREAMAGLEEHKKKLYRRKILSVQSSWNEFTILYISVANAIMESYSMVMDQWLQRLGASVIKKWILWFLKMCISLGSLNFWKPNWVKI